ncbi:MAG: hypothetical protein AAB553_01085 [Patescibacteria group bacterium]
MQITSYFIGIVLENAPFVTLFVRLQQYIKKHKLEDAVLLQNILSLHISLYYFDATLTEDQKKAVKEDAEHLSLMHETLEVSPIKGSYFNKGTNNTLCYITCSQTEVLEKLHSFFTKKYLSPNVPENQYAYIPHLSLFTILDSDKYAQHKKAVDQIIIEEIELLKKYSLVKDIQLFQVNSLFSPEIQIPV